MKQKASPLAAMQTVQYVSPAVSLRKFTDGRTSEFRFTDSTKIDLNPLTNTTTERTADGRTRTFTADLKANTTTENSFDGRTITKYKRDGEITAVEVIPNRDNAAFATIKTYRPDGTITTRNTLTGETTTTSKDGEVVVNRKSMLQ